MSNNGGLWKQFSAPEDPSKIPSISKMNKLDSSAAMRLVPRTSVRKRHLGQALGICQPPCRPFAAPPEPLSPCEIFLVFPAHLRPKIGFGCTVALHKGPSKSPPDLRGQFGLQMRQLPGLDLGRLALCADLPTNHDRQHVCAMRLRFPLTRCSYV